MIEIIKANLSIKQSESEPCMHSLRSQFPPLKLRLVPETLSLHDSTANARWCYQDLTVKEGPKAVVRVVSPF